MIVLRRFRKRGRTAQVCNSRITRKRETEVTTNIYIYIYIYIYKGVGLVILRKVITYIGNLSIRKRQEEYSTFICALSYVVWTIGTNIE